jgi:hypothetical protein
MLDRTPLRRRKRAASTNAPERRLPSLRRFRTRPALNAESRRRRRLASALSDATLDVAVRSAYVRQERNGLGHRPDVAAGGSCDRGGREGRAAAAARLDALTVCLRRDLNLASIPSTSKTVVVQRRTFATWTAFEQPPTASARRRRSRHPGSRFPSRARPAVGASAVVQIAAHAAEAEAHRAQAGHRNAAVRTYGVTRSVLRYATGSPFRVAGRYFH